VRKQVDVISPPQVLTSLSSHKAIIAYLSSVNLSSSASALREELAIGDGFDEATSKKYEGLLEKKWTSVVRLQKKVREPVTS
jgi:platelet-activating factor acetylhydrolase IB subunit alpha